MDFLVKVLLSLLQLEFVHFVVSSLFDFKFLVFCQNSICVFLQGFVFMVHAFYFEKRSFIFLLKLVEIGTDFLILLVLFTGAGACTSVFLLLLEKLPLCKTGNTYCWMENSLSFLFSPLMMLTI